ncbi:hypothetical protein DVH05_028074 [Phytophthora capsici]|nr:hypothetical protein DVH05_028074 [Phytophthora capsici]
MTPRMDNLSSAGDGIALRPGTTLSSRRPPTGGSQRPVSRGSTISISSVTAILDSPGVHRQLNLDEIDGIKEELRGALDEERLLLLEDIEFIQGCLEMEKDLIDDDRRKAATGNPRPSLSDLHDLRKTLEKTLQDQDAAEKMENLLRKANTFRNRKLSPVPPPATTRPIRSSPSPSLSRNGSATRVLKIRHLVQESRDEPYLS